MFFIYLSQGIYWNSDTSPLLGDGYHQYVIFDTTLRNILHGTDSLFYSFQSGLGINFYALSSYYLGSFFSPLVYFFNVQSMPDAVYLITLLKFGAIGLSTYISLHGMFSKIPRSLVLTLSTSFALMSFAISQIEIKTWLDVFILAPLILYGFKKLIYNEGEILYFISLTSLFIQNYYFGFMMSIFLILWYLTQLSWDIKGIGKRFFHFVIVSLLSVITSLVMLYPTFLDLRTHGESFSKVDSIFTEKSWYLDVFAKNFIGSFDTTKYGSIPMIYVGLFPLLLAITFFFVKSIKFHVKLSYIILLTILILSFRFQLLDLLWQGMHAPNMFLHRYSWIFSLTIILMAGEVLNRIEEITWIRFSLANFLLILGFGATVLYSNHYKFLDAVNFIVTFEFLIAGDGNLLEKMKSKVNSMGLKENIKFIGNVAETAPVYSASDLTINCSIKEGLALTSYESLSMGVPVISSDVGGQKELINNEVGIIVPLHQDEEDIREFKYSDEEIMEYVNGINEILDNLDEYKANCRKRILDGFTINQMVVRMNDIIEEIYNNPSETVIENGRGLSNNKSIVGVIMPSKIDLFFGTGGIFTTKYIALHFGEDGIAVMLLNNLTGKIESKSSFLITNNRIKSIIFKKNFLSYQLVISGENFELKCRVNKITIAASWHKKGLANILEQYN